MIERRHEERRQSQQGLVASAHYVCPSCPFEGDEEAMIEHAQAVGHVAIMEPDPDELSRMEGVYGSQLGRDLSISLIATEKAQRRY